MMIETKTESELAYVQGELVINLFFPVFSNYLITVVLTKDIHASVKARDKYILSEGTETVEACCSKSLDDAACFIFLRPNATSGTIAHECYHAIVNLMNAIQAKMENEIVAYYLGYLVDEIMEFKNGTGAYVLGTLKNKG